MTHYGDSYCRRRRDIVDFCYRCGVEMKFGDEFVSVYHSSHSKYYHRKCYDSLFY